MSGGIVNNNTMAVPTRFPSGLTNVTEQHPFGYYPNVDALKSHQYVNDFDNFTAANWTITKTGTGTTAIIAGDGGLLALTNTAASGDLIELQLPFATYSFTAGRRMIYKALVQVDDATNAEFFLGLQNTNTDATAATDGAYFHKASGGTSIDFVTVSGSTVTTIAAVATMTAATLTSLAFFYDGKSEIRIYYNSNQVSTQPTIAAPLGYTLNNPTTALPTGNMNITTMIKNGTAAARTLTVDAIEVMKERFV